MGSGRGASGSSSWQSGAEEGPSGTGPGQPLHGIVAPMASQDPTRLLIVEDVPQVAQFIRGLIATQAGVKLLDVISDGAKAVAQIEQLRPDVVLVDALLQGRVKGPALVQHIAESTAPVPVIVLTVPQTPIDPDPEHGVHGVLAMPFSAYDLMTQISHVRQAFSASSLSAGSRLLTVFAPKGGVGKTTVAFNLAVACSQLGRRTALIDGNLQFGDLRSLLKVPGDAPSILDLPTDRVTEADLQDVMWRDPSGIDILMAPPRIEMAEMVTIRDIDKALSLIRRVYEVVIIDTGSYINDITLSFLDASDTIVELVTYDSTTIHNTIAMADAFRSIGYPASKVQYLVNRADSAGGINHDDLVRALGRVPEHSIQSDGRLVVEANNKGVPFVLDSPSAPVSQDVARAAEALVAALRTPVGAGRG